MWKAVARGFVRHEDAVFVNNGLRDGFTAGVDVNQLGGHRWFKNYQSALDGREPVTRAIMKRVQAGKTLDLGLWNNALADGIKNSGALATVNISNNAIPNDQQANLKDICTSKSTNLTL